MPSPRTLCALSLAIACLSVGCTVFDSATVGEGAGGPGREASDPTPATGGPGGGSPGGRPPGGAPAEAPGGGSGPAVPTSGPRLVVRGGALGGAGYLDAAGEDARFSDPRGIARDGAGNLYVADAGNRRIRKISPSGVVSTVADVDATPEAIAVDGAGNILFTVLYGSHLGRVSPAGVVTFVGVVESVTGGYVDGPLATAQFSRPTGVAADAAGNFFVADSSVGAVRKISPAGDVTTIARSADRGGALPYTPFDVAVDPAGNLIVACDRPVGPDFPSAIVRLTAAGAQTVLATGLAFPRRITVDAAGNVFARTSGGVTRIDPAGIATLVPGDWRSGGIEAGLASDGAGGIFAAIHQSVRRVTAAGVVSSFAGKPKAANRFTRGLVVDSAGNAIVSDASALRKYTPAGVASDVLTGGMFGWSHLALDGAGNVLSSSYVEHVVWKAAPGMKSVLAGAPNTLGNADGTGAAARFSSPAGVAVDSAGALFVADSNNRAIRKVSPAGVVTTIADLAAAGVGPRGLALDGAAGFFATTDNRVVRITAAGAVTTLAGAAARGSADGTGAAAAFDYPAGLAVDSMGNVFVADTGNGTVRKVTPAGVVTTVAGVAGRLGVVPGALPGTLNRVYGIAAVSPDHLVVVSEDAAMDVFLK